MIDDMPDRPPPPLTPEERNEKIEAAVETNAGNAFRGYIWKTLVLGEMGGDPEETARGVIESPDHGLAMAQAAFDDLPEERRLELMGKTLDLMRHHASEAALQIETAVLNIGEDPRDVEPDLIATIAGLPIIQDGTRFLKQQG